MRQHGREIDDAGGLIDRRGLYCGDLMLAQGLAHDIEPTRERSIPKRLFSPSLSIRTDVATSDFSGLISSACALASAAAKLAID